MVRVVQSPMNTRTVPDYILTGWALARLCIFSLLSCGIMLVHAHSAPCATSYYVDPAGDDSHSGMSTSNAWRTVGKVNSIALQPGDAVYFKSGGLWRETLKPHNGGTAGNPVTFAGYGSGPNPRISGADTVTGWSVYGGNLYEASLNLPAGNVFVDSGPGWGLTEAYSISSMTPGSWYWSNGSRRLYLWLFDNSNPSTHTIEAATRLYGYETLAGSGSAGTCVQFS